MQSHDEVLAVIGKSVRNLRLARTGPAQDSAEACGCDAELIEELATSARPIRIDEVFRVSEALGVPVMALFYTDDLPWDTREPSNRN